MIHFPVIQSIEPGTLNSERISLHVTDGTEVSGHRDPNLWVATPSNPQRGQESMVGGSRLRPEAPSQYILMDSDSPKIASGFTALVVAACVYRKRPYSRSNLAAATHPRKKKIKAMIVARDNTRLVLKHKQWSSFLVEWSLTFRLFYEHNPRTMSGPSLALASLTATYTDSEGEDEVEDVNDKSPNDNSSANSVGSLVATPPPSIKPLNKVARLVSYHDDTMLSDEEGAVGDLGEAAERRRSLGADGEPPEDDVRLPPEPTGRCSNELQEKINRLYEKMQTTGLDMNRVIQQRKDFRNPSIYEKLIQFCSINELGTNYPAHLYDPLRWGKESYYEELAKVQKTEMDRREKEKKDKTKVEFVSGTAKRPGSGSGAEDEAKKRKSKWDQVGTVGVSSTMTGSQGGNILKPAGLLQQPSLTTSATGTKGTVISAFGSLPKKPRV
ncbi:unnamed protein product [Timema podura]|uniref:SAP30-binding protein n=1 Tax=Timema podura TaxID=61482 RepID=A0ABN7NPN2_TIMPD|nr:unnamed protein product [Timema podura]